MSESSYELYRFIWNQSTIVTYTSGDQPVIYDAGDGDETYAPIPIGRTTTDAKGDISRQNITISIPIDNSNAQEWFINAGEYPLTLTIFSYSKADGVAVEWKGRLSALSPENSTMGLVFESVFTSMRRNGLRMAYQIGCPYALYGVGCGLDKEDFATVTDVTDVAANVITATDAASFADGYFTGGIFKDNAGNMRFITDHTGDQITLIRPIVPPIQYVSDNGYTGLSGTLYPGCDRSVSTCDAKFSNLLNFGGFPFMPDDNPFDGSSLV